ncbi:AAA family ATPase [Actinacidiphila glaucinigra]|uniref:AAA family ATPase n=1 Tax=Actinacidiphila glaucinigra TaxID=235986 RepID=UPI0038668D4E
MGRAKELDRIRDFLGATGHDRALLLSGPAGVGKTVLLGAVAEAASATGTRVLRAAGVEFEAGVSYSGLNQPCRSCTSCTTSRRSSTSISPCGTTWTSSSWSV